jgi:hypothetical protein
MLQADHGPGRQGCGEEGDDRGIDAVVLRQLADGLGELADAIRVEQADRISLLD